MKKKYADKGAAIPPIYLVSQPTGKKKIQTLAGDKEFSVEVLTPDELERKVDEHEIDVGTLMEGPVFDLDFIRAIDYALVNAGSNIPLIMLPEYGNNNPEQRRNLLEHMFRRQTLYGRLKYVDTVYSGFKK